MKKKLKGELDERELNYRTVIDYEIVSKKSEKLRVAKEDELAQIMEMHKLDDEEEEEKYEEIEPKSRSLFN